MKSMCDKHSVTVSALQAIYAAARHRVSGCEGILGDGLGRGARVSEDLEDITTLRCIVAPGLHTSSAVEKAPYIPADHF